MSSDISSYATDPDSIRLRVSAYLAFLVLLIYDHALTLDLEVEAIWSSTWRLPEYLFLINRYCAPPMLAFNVAVYGTPNLSQQFCFFFQHWQIWPNAVSLAIVQLSLVLRVSAIYARQKCVTRFLVGLFICEVFALLGTVILSNRTHIKQEMPASSVLPGCVAYQSEYSTFYVLWLAPLAFESVIIALTVYGLFRLMVGPVRNNPTLRLLARDSLIYFIIMSAILLGNVVLLKVLRNSALDSLLLGPCNVVACIAVARMMLNLRSLPFKTYASSIDSGDQMSTDFAFE